MRTIYKLGLALAVAIIAIVVLAIARPQLVAIPGTLFVAFTAYVAYQNNKRKSGK
jgi:hypothetical protein